MKDDLYKILGVAKNATADQIKKAFRKKAQKAHPDKGGNEGQMSALNRAVQVLTDQRQRARYDETGEVPGGSASEPTIEDKARMSLAKAFDDMLGDEVDWQPHEDPLAKLGKCIDQTIGQYEFEIKKIDSYLTKLKKKATKVKRKTGDDIDLWASMIAEREKRYAAGRKDLTEKIEISKVAHQMLKEYQAEVSKPPTEKKSETFDPWNYPANHYNLYRDV